MTLLWICVLCLLTAVAVVSIVDVIRHRHSGSTTVAWIALIVILPPFGSLIYWAKRKPDPGDAEHQYRAEADMRRDRAGRPFDSTGLGP
jgi:hypothetical protein